jgi:hypothetical protein
LQFQALVKVTLKSWRDVGEDEYAAWFEDQYLTPEWSTWFYASSGLPFCLPSNIPIEIANRYLKEVKLITLHQSTTHLLNVGFPGMLKYDGAKLTGDISWDLGPGFPRPILQAAAVHHLAGHQFFKIKYDSKTTYYFNTRTAFGEGRRGDTAITRERVDSYNNSLTGSSTARQTNTFAAKGISLHKVVVRAPPNSDSPQFACDCKGYFRGGRCSHIAASMHHESSSFDIMAKLEDLSTVKKRGRPRKAAPALIPQQDADAAALRRKRGRGGRGTQDT